MRTIPFPDKIVTDYIEDLAKDFGFNIISTEYVASKDMDELLKKGGHDKWSWTLAKPGRRVHMKISIYSSYQLGISFSNEDLELKGKVSTYFFFDEYLSKHLKAQGDANLLHQVVLDKSWKENWKIQFEVLKDHLKGHLGQVVDGKEWPNIEFNWEDYIEPSALDRIYSDQIKLLEEDSKNKDGKGWLYFLNFKKKR
ncbi:hypothetical protein [Bdellovibrio sp. HCB-110]|uniref:hypothetical protein n=1 Tax=Bdellovibrio sp. HCB-110 TaxID=3391182 RepID=UPI0039B3C408